MSEEYYCCNNCEGMSFNLIDRYGKKVAKCIDCGKELEL